VEGYSIAPLRPRQKITKKNNGELVKWHIVSHYTRFLTTSDTSPVLFSEPKFLKGRKRKTNDDNILSF
jgi:hypothetical protein